MAGAWYRADVLSHEDSVLVIIVYDDELMGGSGVCGGGDACWRCWAVGVGVVVVDEVVLSGRSLEARVGKDLHVALTEIW